MNSNIVLIQQPTQFCVSFVARSAVCLQRTKESFRTVMEGLHLRPRLELKAIDLSLSFFSYSCHFCNCEIVLSVSHLNPIGTCFSWHFITTTSGALINFDTTAFHGLLVFYSHWQGAHTSLETKGPNRSIPESHLRALFPWTTPCSNSVSVWVESRDCDLSRGSLI